MASAARFLQPIRASLASLISPFPSLSHSRIPFYGKFEPLKAWIEVRRSSLYHRALTFHWTSYMPTRFSYMDNFYKPGCKRSANTMYGLSVLIGWISPGSHPAYSMDGVDILVDDCSLDLFGASDSEEDPHILFTLARKFWMPISLFLTVLVNWGHPVTILAEVVLFLFCTKPSPFSVYFFIEQLRHQYMRQHPLLCKFKSLYAKKVEVEDYKLLCLARVELEDQNYTLIGLLGGWWVLPRSPCRAAFLSKVKYFLYARMNSYLNLR